MPYERQISRQHKGCFLFVLNQSRTMLEPIGDGDRRKCDEAAIQVNTWLLNLTIRAAGSDGIKDWMDVGVLGYRTNEEGKPIIESALQGALAGRPLVSIVDVGEHPARMEQVVTRFFDEETEEIVDTPVWVDPKAEGGAPMCRALYEVFQVLDRWISDHYDSFPPIVIHITDGQSDDGDPRPYADPLKELQTNDGNVLLFHHHLSTTAAGLLLFPSTEERLPDEAARALFRMSSVLPENMWQMLRNRGVELEQSARGMSLNTDLLPLLGFFEMGTRVARFLDRELAVPIEPPTLAAAEEDSDATGTGPQPRAEMRSEARSELRAEPPNPLDENVQFSVYRPGTVQPERWYLLLAFTHLSERRPDAPEEEPDPVEEVRRQARLVLEEKFDEYVDLRQDATQPVPREGELTLVPEIPGVQFNPPRRSFFWTEPVHREEFRLRASAGLDGQTARGRLTVFFGSVILAEVSLAIRVDGGHRAEPSASPTDVAFGRPYRKIFASYSHQDVAIVEEFEQYFKTVGDRYLRDCIDLRAGEVWCERLEELICEADVFQLFWSTNSMRSRFVRQEWEYALILGRPHFVRPVYWEEPMPGDPAQNLPPEVLLRLHFQRLPQAGGPHAPPPPSAQPEPAFPAPPAHTPKPRKRRSRAWVALLATALLPIVLVGVVVFDWVSYAPSMPEPPPPSCMPQRPDISAPAQGATARLEVRVWQDDLPKALLNAVPLRTGDTLQIVFDVPEGYEGTLFWFDTEGQLHVLAVAMDTVDSPRLSVWPGPDKVAELAGPPGTEVIFLCATRSGLPSVEDIRGLFGEGLPWPAWSAAGVVEFHHDELRARRVSGPDKLRREWPEIVLQTYAEALRKALAQHYELVQGVAFSHVEP